MTKPKAPPQPVLENPRHEAVAQELADGRMQPVAYLAAEHPELELEERQALVDKDLRDNTPPTRLRMNAGKMCRTPAIRQRVNTILAERHEKRLAVKMTAIKANSAWVIDRLITVIDRCMQAIPVKNGQGDAVGMWRFDSSGAVKALELVGLDAGMFERKHKHLHAKANPLDGNRTEIVGRLGVLIDQLSAGDLESIGLRRIESAEVCVVGVDPVGGEQGTALPAIPETV